jgi:hypothetical protein
MEKPLLPNFVPLHQRATKPDKNNLIAEVIKNRADLFGRSLSLQKKGSGLKLLL